MAKFVRAALSDTIEKLIAQYGCGPVKFSGADEALYERHLLFDSVTDIKVADARDRFEAIARSVRDVLSQRWIRTEQTYESRNPKRVYYLSIEFLLGRSLANNVQNLLLDPVAEQLIKEKNLDRLGLLEQEPDAGLGNGGLGRLAACFLDSMAAMQLPGMGYGLRYEYGMFKQSIDNGWQQERPDNWLRRPDPWEVARPHERVELQLNCSIEVRGGALHPVSDRPSTLIGIPFDRPVVGYGGKTINTLRLWAAAAPDEFNFQEFSHGDFVGAVAERLGAESLTRVLYPDDSTSLGQGLRFVQEYFLVACSLADIVRRFRRDNPDWSTLPEKVAIQLNDTHPAIAVPELMRILLDEAKLRWDEAWDLTRKNAGVHQSHACCPKRSKNGQLSGFGYSYRAIWRSYLKSIGGCSMTFGARFPGDDGRVARISLIEEGPNKHVRMANLAIVGSHSTNGVAEIHSQLLRTTTVKDLAELFPERFNNKTNGVTPRRWLLLANPALARTITEAIGEGWITDLSQLSRLKPLAANRAFRDNFREATRQTKVRFADWLKSKFGVTVDPDSIFDSQVKRIHEYKRQLLNALRIVVLYNRLLENSQCADTTADLFLRRESGARLPPRQAHHKVH